MTSVRSLCLPLCVLACVLLLGGCQRSSSFTVKVEGMKVPREYPIWVDISNWNGEVQVVANDRYSQPEVRARVRALSDAAPRSAEDLRKTVRVRAISNEEAGKRVLRIQGDAATVPTPPVALDLQVRIPRSWGVRVANSGGTVELVGVAGPIDVQNGSPGKPGGSIDIRTGRAITEPVTLITQNGTIQYLVGPGSTGRIEASTTEGMPFVDARVGTVSGVNYQGNLWRGNLGDARNPILLRTHKGDARILVLENAGEIGREYWDGWPEWPTSPRWIAKLGGE